MIRLRHRLRRFAVSEDGTATIEFALCFPVMVFMFIMAFESGMMMIRAIMLERGVDMTMRDLRVGLIPQPATGTMAEELKRRICTNSLVIRNCDEVLVLNLTRISMDFWDMPMTPVECMNRDEDVNMLDSVTTGVGGDLMLVRACVSVDPIFPTSGLGLNLPQNGNDGYWIASVSAFANEPT